MEYFYFTYETEDKTIYNQYYSYIIDNSKYIYVYKLFTLNHQ